MAFVVTTRLAVAAVIFMAAVMCQAFPSKDAAAVVPEAELLGASPNQLHTRVHVGQEMVEESKKFIKHMDTKEKVMDKKAKAFFHTNKKAAAQLTEANAKTHFDHAHFEAKKDFVLYHGLGDALKKSLQKIGQKVHGPKTEPKTVIEEKKLANIKRKVYDKEEAEAEAKSSTMYGRNCITLKAYAMAAADEVDDLKHGAIGVMRPLLQMMAADLDATQVTEASCIVQFENITGSLHHDDELTIEGDQDPSNSLAIQQLDELEKAMKGEGDVHPIAQGKGTAIEAACHGNHDQYDCAEMSKENVGGQWMWVDGEAIGLGKTDIPIFKKIAVRQQRLQTVARNMLKFGMHHHVIETTNRDHTEFTTKDGEIIKNWDGNF